MQIQTATKLSSGAEIPNLGFGVWKARKDDCYRAVQVALETGYRHIDTAAIYGNEGQVGQALAESGLKRDEYFVTTKLWNSDQGYDSAFEAIEKSLDKLKLARVDLYLIHYPVSQKRLKSYEALLKIKEEGLALDVGVSNFTQKHLDELGQHFSEMPAVNQVEFHPWLNQVALKNYCESRGIVLEAYSPLSHGEKLNDDRLAAIAKKLGKTPAQVLLRWSLEQGNVILPKSVTPSRIKENAALFDFSLPGDVMSEMNQWNEDLRTCWDPSNVP